MNHSTTSFSNLYRDQNLEKLEAANWDLLVIGGGATGCGIALDAASRGIQTALLEKGDFASGTSSKSTKLIHGGLRYLKQLEFGLVQETGTERAIVHHLAPHLVIPEKMLLPLIEGGAYGKWGTSLGLMVYDFLARVQREDRRRMLSKEQTLELEPLLDGEYLKGGGFYAEYRTDDARLTLELAKTAAAHGALAVNYAKVVDFLYNEENQVCGVVMQDVLGGQKREVTAKKVVCAGGPWVDELRKMDGPLGKKHLQLTKGVHLVFSREKLPVRQSVYFDVPNGRMVFAIPRGRITYVGTTDTLYKGSLDRVVATRDDARYLLEAVNHAFPSVELSEADIISNWSGLRPLIHEEGKAPSELSRKDEIFVSENGLISIAGGKLTGYRKMAQRVVNRVAQILQKAEGRTFKPCTTADIALTPDPLPDVQSVGKYISELKERVEAIGLDAYYGWYLATNYGRQAEPILQRMDKNQTSSPEINLARAELWFTLHQEAVARAEDFFVRRTGRLFFHIQSIPLIRKTVMDELQEAFGWDEKRRELEEKMVDLQLQDATTYYEREFSAGKI